ncbi:MULTISPECIES: DUF7427 family protein [Gordonia]|uniref:Uncharacterized protein n=1 Tax=Gordonia sihwensis NBRC 108236 TaxID=1223544 RepID=L7LKS1_9ACTN|nr:MULTISPECIES: hypothetical protein [Gordonia]AUH68503.1 hypothetical protein CXX93_09255 [Gordonia sp. YC-JH1]GAC60633.1 hypothetical protein GSI01S_10_02260 [Gordonia sihwensis NBRC 108236]
MIGEATLAALIGSVIGYEAWCIRTGHHDALLSRTVDRLRARHIAIDIAAHLIIGTTALHLVRRLPAALDPYSRCST